MITVRQLAQEVIRLLAGGDPSAQSPYDEGYVMRMVRQAANTFIRPMVLGNMSEDDRSVAGLLKVRYLVDVLDDGITKYITLPEFYEPLAFNKGLVGIAPLENPTQYFIPRHNPSVSHNLPCGDVEGQQSYWTEGFKASFDKDIELGKVIVVLLVAAPDSIGPDAALPIFPDWQLPIINLVRQMYLNRPVQDKTLDNNPNM